MNQYEEFVSTLKTVFEENGWDIMDSSSAYDEEEGELIVKMILDNKSPNALKRYAGHTEDTINSIASEYDLSFDEIASKDVNFSGCSVIMSFLEDEF